MEKCHILALVWKVVTVWITYIMEKVYPLYWYGKPTILTLVWISAIMENVIMENFIMENVVMENDVVPQSIYVTSFT